MKFPPAANLANVLNTLAPATVSSPSEPAQPSASARFQDTLKQQTQSGGADSGARKRPVYEAVITDAQTGSSLPPGEQELPQAKSQARTTTAPATTTMTATTAPTAITEESAALAKSDTAIAATQAQLPDEGLSVGSVEDELAQESELPIDILPIPRDTLDPTIAISPDWFDPALLVDPTVEGLVHPEGQMSTLALADPAVPELPLIWSGSASDTSISGLTGAELARVTPSAVQSASGDNGIQLQERAALVGGTPFAGGTPLVASTEGLVSGDTGAGLWGQVADVGQAAPLAADTTPVITTTGQPVATDPFATEPFVTDPLATKPQMPGSPDASILQAAKLVVDPALQPSRPLSLMTLSADADEMQNGLRVLQGADSDLLSVGVGLYTALDVDDATQKRTLASTTSWFDNLLALNKTTETVVPAPVAQLNTLAPAISAADLLIVDDGSSLSQSLNNSIASSVTNSPQASALYAVDQRQQAAAEARNAATQQAAAVQQNTGQPLDTMSRAGALELAFGQSGWADRLGQQLLLQSAQGSSSARIRLDPPELGSLMVKIQLVDQTAAVNFVSPHAIVRDALEQQSLRLQDMFREQGMNLVDVSVSDQSSGNRNSDEQSENPKQGRSNPMGFAASSEVAHATRVSDALIDYYA